MYTHTCHCKPPAPSPIAFPCPSLLQVSGRQPKPNAGLLSPQAHPSDCPSLLQAGTVRQPWQVVAAVVAAAMLAINLHRSAFTMLVPLIASDLALGAPQVSSAGDITRVWWLRDTWGQNRGLPKPSGPVDITRVWPLSDNIGQQRRHQGLPVDTNRVGGGH